MLQFVDAIGEHLGRIRSSAWKGECKSMLMNISQLGYDFEKEVITFNGTELKQGDPLEIYIPSPVSGEMEWVSVRLEWTRTPRERWYFACERTEFNALVATCNPVGLFARK